MPGIAWAALFFLAVGVCARVALWGMTRERIDIRDEDGDHAIYLQRWILFGHRSSAGGKDRPALMLHRICRPDADRCHHDHPWGFWTLILWGGYVEEYTFQPDATEGGWRGGPMMARRWVRPGMFAYRRATYTHRIAELPSGPSWSLVLRTRYQRRWGFHTPHGWVYFRDAFGKLVEWCRS